MIELLSSRANFLAQARSFFFDRNILEVDCCAIQPFAAIDAQIDSISVDLGNQRKGYLHTSPEIAMKKLIGKGSGSIYQLAHVFRKEEFGKRHHPEFMMAEWYHIGAEWSSFIEETADFIRLFLPDLPTDTLSYRDAFQQYLSIDPFTATEADLTDLLEHLNIDVSDGIKNESKDTLLNLLLSHAIEPHLGKESLLILTEYPSSQAALARTETKGGFEVAKRFEIYHKGIELANGYHELSCAKEQKRRFIEENKTRVQMGKKSYQIDEGFLAALAKLPDCCGVSVGFDRLLMLHHQKESIHDVRFSNSWSS